ncbi:MULTISPECIES: hypothetical protein [unclassified Streptomyces]|uniref:hypothetical protein n=1 Tax=unclassified Streptomyces TaxID=2593676 RepID=UPI001370171C|nr:MULTISPECIES: hypothetical protein [unclassified Streptomyces]NDZ99502.1 hypothetical protein [Streptomyces sp. SID10116]MYY79895.1 hypothetical protein [Streptomyces sp. SID335]MYZ14933.1 hypothetical protein [Streptomyces sp. SID337]NDZ88529.1 hypothetical protein [Streptomyces sp. SID10115]NEB45191.1 hypothetical protein [Streptomyces sp. SID339]
MPRKDGRDSSQERDVERLLDELYATAPPQFVSRREELAARARTDGRAEDARRIRAARRPTLAAWAANLLLHSQPTESRRFLELGRELREAYRTLDAAEIKELSGQRTSVVSALSRQAATLARDAGHRLSDAAQQDVASTLRAVLADEEAADQWATGRLESTLTPPSDFPSGTDAAPKARAAATAVRRTPRERSGPEEELKDELAERRRQKQEKRAREAREAAEAADRRLGERRAEQEEADASLRQARDRHDQARRRVSDAEDELQRARRVQKDAEREQKEAEKRGRAAADAVAEAEQAARKAAEESERLREELD